MQREQTAVGAGRVLFRYAIPLPELAGDFYDKLKAATAGYATLDYEEGPWRPADLVKLDVRVNGEEVDALAQVVPAASHLPLYVLCRRGVHSQRAVRPDGRSCVAGCWRAGAAAKVVSLPLM